MMSKLLQNPRRIDPVSKLDEPYGRRSMVPKRNTSRTKFQVRVEIRTGIRGVVLEVQTIEDLEEVVEGVEAAVLRLDGI